MNEILKPMITTIIPTYRRPKLLKQAVDSVLKQTYPHFIVCVYDNASGDDTASVVAEIAKADPRVRYYCHSENIGQHNNFQYALKHVQTPFFSFLSDDDIVLPGFFETALAGFERYPKSMLSITDVIYKDTKGNILKTGLETWITNDKECYYPPDGLIAILEYGYSHWVGTLFRKTVIENIGFFDPEVWCFDLDFVLRISAHYPFVISKHPCAVYNVFEDLRLPFDIIWPGWLKMAKNLTGDKSLSDDIRAQAEEILLGNFEKTLFATGFGYLCRGESVDAKKVAALLRDKFGKSAHSSALSLLINMHENIPLTRFAFSSFYKNYQNILDMRVKDNQKKYSDIRACLNELSLAR